ncbi:MAG: septation protein SepH [Actinomycetota bacterium]|nr:septation protein SepH [Actinomycetota bacterium]
MKRLHIVGKSKDNKRLFLAQKSGAKFGSFEVSVGRKLLRLIEEIQEGRSDSRRPAPPANQGDRTGVRVLPSAAPAGPTDGPDRPGGRGSGGARQLRIAGDDIDIPVDANQAGARTDDGPAVEDAAVPPLFATDPGVATAAATEAVPEPPVAVRPTRTQPAPRRTRPEIPARSKLSPAEIQGLIRAGRGVRSVANLAGTPVAWVKYLAEPIQQERLGIVRQMLVARQERARLGPSSAPIGQSILENLRGRGVRNPEAVVEQSFTAHRPDGREWRVRLAFDHRGNRYVANWSFDPQTREVTPLNTMATQLGWRRQPGADDEQPKPRRRSRSSAKRSSSRKRSTGKKSSTRRTAAARKTAGSKRTTTSRRSSAARKSSSRSGSGRR